MTTLSLTEFMTKLKNQDKTAYKQMMQHLMSEYGSSLHCNRFAIGNCNEYAIGDLIVATGLGANVLQNAKRVDIDIDRFGKFSIKYSSGGNVKLHNSNNQSNTDVSMCDTLLVTPTTWWFLRPTEIEALGITLKDYLHNTGDGLELKSSILTALKAKNYPHVFAFDISVKKTECKNKEINRIIYDHIKAELAKKAV
jgi:hypothetical protein